MRKKNNRIKSIFALLLLLAFVVSPLAVFAEGKGEKDAKEDITFTEEEEVTITEEDSAASDEEEIAEEDSEAENEEVSEAKEEVTVTVSIEGPDTLVNESVLAPEECEVIDTNGNSHAFPSENSSEGALAICVLVAMQEEGHIEDFTFVAFDFGLWLDSINGIATTEDWSAFWALWHNEEMAEVGIADLVVEDGDMIALLYPVAEETEEESSEEDNSAEEEENTPSGNGGGGGGDSTTSPPVELDIDGAVAKALVFLQGQPVTADSVVAFYASGHTADISFIKKFSADDAISYAKPILAIVAAGEDPRTFPNENFVAKLKSFAIHEQLGDEGLVNDDIWGMLALRAAGVPADDAIIQNSKSFLLSQQNPNGGWAWNAGGDSDTNDTSAAVMALLEAGMNVSDAPIMKAIEYLKAAQNDDGGFPYDPVSTFSTDSDGNSDAWVIMAINKIGQDAKTWVKNGKNPVEHLLSLQDEDGGFWWMAPPAEFNNKGATADAVLALSGKSIPVFLMPAPVLEAQEQSNGGTVSEPLGENRVEEVGEEAIRALAEEEKVAVLAQIQAELQRVEQEAETIAQQLAILAAQEQKAAFAATREAEAEKETENLIESNDEEDRTVAGSQEEIQVFGAEVAAASQFAFMQNNTMLVVFGILLVGGMLAVYVMKFRRINKKSTS